VSERAGVSRLLVPGSFTWGVGIEDTFIGQRHKQSGRILDEYALTQHYRRWRSDLDRAASLGVQAIRYGVPWYRVNPSPGRYDWAWADAALERAAGRHGLMVIADLVHYGTPLWLKDSFADRDYPAAVGEYASAFASRYSHLLNHYTPLNEPTVTASFCGQRGVWPPYLSGWSGWARIVMALVEGMRASIEAIRKADPRAVVVHVESSKPVMTSDPELAKELELERGRGFLPTDLLLGLVDGTHPLHSWLTSEGVDEDQLAAFQVSPPDIDVIGINYYPDLSPRELVRHNGEVVQVAHDGWDRGLTDVLREFQARYGLPLLVAETSTEGSDVRRSDWLAASTAAVMDLRLAGVPITGYIWWPLFDMVDWSYSLAGASVEEFMLRNKKVDGSSELAAAQFNSGTDGEVSGYLRHMGLWRLSPNSNGSLGRIETETASRFRQLITGNNGHHNRMRRREVRLHDGRYLFLYERV
jgi:beta-glucosidase/6-phospho-beta-glucosidase/beta-galactosidase